MLTKDWLEMLTKEWLEMLTKEWLEMLSEEWLESILQLMVLAKCVPYTPFPLAKQFCTHAADVT